MRKVKRVVKHLERLAAVISVGALVTVNCIHEIGLVIYPEHEAVFVEPLSGDTAPVRAAIERIFDFDKALGPVGQIRKAVCLCHAPAGRVIGIVCHRHLVYGDAVLCGGISGDQLGGAFGQAAEEVLVALGVKDIIQIKFCGAVIGEHHIGNQRFSVFEGFNLCNPLVNPRRQVRGRHIVSVTCGQIELIARRRYAPNERTVYIGFFLVGARRRIGRVIKPDRIFSSGEEVLNTAHLLARSINTCAWT